MLGHPAKSDMAKSKREWISDTGNTRINEETGEMKRKVIPDMEVLFWPFYQAMFLFLPSNCLICTFFGEKRLP